MNTAQLIAALKNLSTDSNTVEAAECDGGIAVEIFNIAPLTDAVYQQFNVKWELAVTALLTAGYKYRGETVDGNGIHCMTWLAPTA